MDTSIVQEIGSHVGIAGASLFGAYKWFKKESRKTEKEEEKKQDLAFQLQQRILTYANEEVERQRNLRISCEEGRRTDSVGYDAVVKELRNKYDTLSTLYYNLLEKFNKLEIKLAASEKI